MDKEVELVLENVRRDLTEKYYILRDEQREAAARIRAVEDRTTITEQDGKTMSRDISVIKSDTRWILKIIVGSVAVGLLALLFSAGGGA